MSLTNTFPAFYEREVESKPNRKLAIFSAFLVLNIVLFGYFGVFKGYQAISAKRQLIKEYGEISKNLARNLDRATILEPYLDKNRGVEFVREAIPVGGNEHAYLETLVFVAGEQGFVVKSVNFTGGEEGVYELDIQLVGDEQKLADLFTAIEKTKRTNKIVSISTTKDLRDLDTVSVNEVQVSVKLHIYSVKE